MRVAVFVDSSSLYFMQRLSLGWSVDLKKLIEYFENRGATVTDAFFYTTYNPSDMSQSGFLQMITNFGYAVISKPIKTIQTENGLKIKSEMNVEIVLDMYNLIDHYDVAVLVSGDSEFERALKMLRARGRDFYVISHDDTLSKELRNLAGDHYLNVADMERYVRLQQRPQVRYAASQA